MHFDRIRKFLAIFLYLDRIYQGLHTIIIFLNCFVAFPGTFTIIFHYLIDSVGKLC